MLALNIASRYNASVTLGIRSTNSSPNCATASGDFSERQLIWRPGRAFHRNNI